VRDEITIGRQEGNTIRLTERNVSRHHARLLRQNGHVLVEDLGSYNGVRINGERIQGQAQVGDGDLIQIGDYDLALQKEAAAQVGAGAPTIRMPAAALQAAMNDAPDASADAEAEEAEPPAPQAEDDAPTPSSADQRRHSTAVIRMDQVEMNRSRKVEALDPEEAPHLVVVSAEFKGQEFACIRTEMRIGRTDDNDIALDHRSLSRTHAKIVREDSGEWRIIDMQSANGMAVNGESYAQAPLAHGDLVELGHVKLRFVGPGQSTAGLLHEGAAKGGGSKKPLLLAVVGVVVLGVLGAAWFFMNQSSTPTPPPPAVVDNKPPAPQPQPTPQEPPRTATPTPAPQPAEPAEPAIPQLEQKLQSARAAIEALDFDKAVDTLETIKDANGQHPAEVAELLNQARPEQQFRQNLDLAKKELAANRPQEAQKYLEASSGTLAFADEHAELKQQVDEALAPPAKPNNTKSTSGTGTARRPSPTELAKQSYDDGMVLNNQRQFREADARFKKCIDIDPTFASCYMMRGSMQARLGNPDDGAQFYREFLKLAPNHQMAPAVRKLIADYDKRQKQPGGGQ
jgi:pSer/pThr/pTyr-binding forkhead associated (FHA) protein